VNGGVFLNSEKITYLVKFQLHMLYINLWSEHPMGDRRGGKTGICLTPEIGTKKQKFLGNLKSAF